MQEARAKLGSECARCGEPCPKLVVDHAEKPFARIVDEFLVERGLTLTELRVRGSKAGFRLRKHGRDWRKFHDAKDFAMTRVALAPDRRISPPPPPRTPTRPSRPASPP